MPRHQCRHRQEQVFLDSRDLRSIGTGGTRCGLSKLAWSPEVSAGTNQLSS